MRNLGWVSLAILVLLLAAWNARLRERVRELEARPALAEKKAAPPPPAPLPAPESEPLPPAPAVEAPPPPAKAPPAAKVVEPRAMILGNAKAGHVFTLSLDASPTGGVDALPLSDAQRKLLESIRKDREVETKILNERFDAAILGVLTPEQRAALERPAVEAPTASGRTPGYLGISGSDEPGGGARVNEVMDGGMAKLFGLRKDDVILEFNGEPVAGLGSLAEKIRETGEGFAATMKIRRDGAEFSQAVRLGARPR